MKRKKLNKRFEAMLDMAAKPSVEAKRKLEVKHPDDYNDKQTHSRKTANASDSHNDTSR